MPGGLPVTITAAARTAHHSVLPPVVQAQAEEAPGAAVLRRHVPPEAGVTKAEFHRLLYVER